MAERERMTVGVLKSNDVSAKVLKVGGDPLAGTASTDVTDEVAALVGEASSATITVGTESVGNAINVAVQLKDANGNDMAVRSTSWPISATTPTATAS